LHHATPVTPRWIQLRLPNSPQAFPRTVICNSTITVITKEDGPAGQFSSALSTLRLITRLSEYLRLVHSYSELKQTSYGEAE
jgi:hypothetical protein